MKHVTRSLLAACLALSAVPAGAQSEVAVPAVPSAQDVPIAFLADLGSGQILHAREADRRFVPASVTKVMTTFLAFEMLDEGRLKPDQMFTMDRQTFRDWGRKGSSMFLNEGDQATVDQLLHGITTVSANDGCAVMAVGATGSVEKWVALMNAKARELGMTNSHFGTPNGWMDEGRTFVTARDLFILSRALITRHPELYRRYIGKPSYSFNGIVQSNHDPMIGHVLGADGIKTGFTRQAGYNYLGSAERDGRRLLMVIAGTDRPAIRTQAARAFIEWGFTHFATRTLFATGKPVARAAIQGGAARSVPLVASRPLVVSFAQGTQPKISLMVHYTGPLKAPVQAGAEVAELEIRIAGQEPFRTPLVAAQNVAEANWWQRLRNGLAGLFA